MKTPLTILATATVALIAVFHLSQRSEDRQSYDTRAVVLSTDGNNAAAAESTAVLESPSSFSKQSSNELEIADTNFGPAGYQEYIDHSSNDARAMSPDQWSDTGDLTFAAPSSAMPIQQMPIQSMPIQSIPIQQMPSMNGSPVNSYGNSAMINSYPSTNQPPIQPMPGQSIATGDGNVDTYQSSVSSSSIASDSISPESLSPGAMSPDPVVRAATMKSAGISRAGQARKNASRFGLIGNPHYTLTEEHFSSPIEEPAMASETELQEGSVAVPNSSPIQNSLPMNDTPPMQQPLPTQQALTTQNSGFSMQSDPAVGQGMTTPQNYQPAQQFNQPVQQYHQSAPQYQTYNEGSGNNAYSASLPAHASPGAQPIYGNVSTGNFYNAGTGSSPSGMAAPVDHGFVPPPTFSSTSYATLMQGPEFPSTQPQPQPQPQPPAFASQAFAPQNSVPQSFVPQAFEQQSFEPQAFDQQSLAPQFNGDVGQRSPFKTVRPQPFQSYDKFAFEDKEQFPKPGELLKTAVYFMDLELGVLQPSFQNNTAISSSSPSFSSTQSFDFDYDTAPRVRVGFESEYGPGFVLDYTQFDQNSDLSTFTSDGITTGATSISSLGLNSSTIEASALGESLNAKHSFELHSYSLSAFKALKFKRARIAGRFGLQYVQIEQELDARTFGPAGTETARLLGTSEFEGFGPRFGLDYFRPVGHTPLELIASATATLLFGNRDQQVSNTQSGSFSDIGADEFITVIDIFTGLQTRKMRGEKRSTFFRFGYVNQTWIGGGTAIDPAGDFGLQGISIAVGLNR